MHCVFFSFESTLHVGVEVEKVTLLADFLLYFNVGAYPLNKVILSAHTKKSPPPKASYKKLALHLPKIRMAGL